MARDLNNRLRGVENRLDVHEDASGVAALEGSGEGRQMASGSSPATQLLIGAAGAGLLVYGALRGRPLSSLLGVVGLALFAEPIAQPEFKRLIGATATEEAAGEPARKPLPR
jgi:hypothetical protein